MTASNKRTLRLIAAGASALIVVVTVFVVLDRAGFLPRSDTCEAGSVTLSSEQAMKATTAVARGNREGLRRPQLRARVAEAAGLDDADAAAVVGVIGGYSRDALTCDYSNDPDSDSDRLSPVGLTPRAAAVRTSMREAFGALPMGGYSPRGVKSGHMKGSKHYAGRAVDVFFRPINPDANRRGRVLASYLVAHAKQLDIATVIYDARIWTMRRAGEGWRPYDVNTMGASAATAKVLEHRDHVHVDVAD